MAVAVLCRHAHEQRLAQTVSVCARTAGEVEAAALHGATGLETSHLYTSVFVKRPRPCGCGCASVIAAVGDTKTACRLRRPQR